MMRQKQTQNQKQNIYTNKSRLTAREVKQIIKVESKPVNVSRHTHLTNQTHVDAEETPNADEVQPIEDAFL